MINNSKHDKEMNMLDNIIYYLLLIVILMCLLVFFFGFINILIDYLHTEGVTHIDRYKNYWSGNFRGWIMYRKLLDV